MAAAKAKAKAAARQASEQEAPWRLHHQSPHLIWAAPNRIICRRCGRSSAASAVRHRRAFARTPCTGSAAGRALARLGLDGNALDSRCRLSSAVLTDMGYTPMLEEDRLEGADLAPRPPPHPPEHHVGDERDDDEGDGPPMDIDSIDREVTDPGEAAPRLDQPRPLKRHRHDRRAQESTAEDERVQMPLRIDITSPDSSSPSGMKRGRCSDATSGSVEPARKQPRDERDSAGSSMPSPCTDPPPSQRPPTTWLAGTAWGRGHEVRINGLIDYCARCGKYAIERVGIGLTSACSGPEAYTRMHVDRMRRGQHPVSGVQLTLR